MMHTHTQAREHTHASQRPGSRGPENNTHTHTHTHAEASAQDAVASEISSHTQTNTYAYTITTHLSVVALLGWAWVGWKRGSLVSCFVQYVV
jgi:hypothetical protein